MIDPRPSQRPEGPDASREVLDSGDDVRGRAGAAAEREERKEEESEGTSQGVALNASRGTALLQLQVTFKEQFKNTFINIKWIYLVFSPHDTQQSRMFLLVLLCSLCIFRFIVVGHTEERSWVSA